ncbi:YncE family protein [Blastococcus sp. TF02-8]|uniref:YncE family protein n=1 Tax=Blastococcus sp. TF02-8 TaxID=2250574 RepID=UPI000DEAC90D|nr:YncE family protein [Blastococcus sp. TF02-8]RBY97503.1 YncE family protein [Blastococcus sp. TF02-8]
MPSRRAALAALAVLLVAGCSAGTSPEEGARPGAAEPGDSPVPDRSPAGTVSELAPGPEGMVLDAATGLLAVAVREPNRLLLVDAATQAVVREVPLPGHARHLQLAAPGGPVLVPAEDSDSYLEVALPGGEVRCTQVGEYPHDAARVASGETLVADELGGTLSVVRDGEVLATLTDQTQPGGIAAVGDLAGVVDVGAFTLTTYDVPEAERLSSVDAGAGPTHVVADDRDRLLVADTRGDGVLVFAADPLEKVDAHRLPGTPYGLAFDPVRHVLWVSLTARNEVVGLATDGPRLREVARFPTVRQPNSVAVDPRDGRVFVAGRTTGELQTIRP